MKLILPLMKSGLERTIDARVKLLDSTSFRNNGPRSVGELDDVGQSGQQSASIFPREELHDFE